MKKPKFEQYRHEVIRDGKPLPQQEREPFRQGMVDFLEDTRLFFVQRARKDGHNDALIELHCSWVGTSFDPYEVRRALQEIWPGSLFGAAEEMHWIEVEEEVTTLQFAAQMENGRYLTGRIKITP